MARVRWKGSSAVDTSAARLPTLQCLSWLEPSGHWGVLCRATALRLPYHHLCLDSEPAKLEMRQVMKWVARDWPYSRSNIYSRQCHTFSRVMLCSDPVTCSSDTKLVPQLPIPYLFLMLPAHCRPQSFWNFDRSFTAQLYDCSRI